MVSGNLHVINVSSADQGQYTCTAANHITDELIDGQRVLKLVVRGAPVRTKPATITWKPEERYISQIGMCDGLWEPVEPTSQFYELVIIVVFI